MQKIFKFLGLFLFIIIAIGFYSGLISARVTGNMPTNPDALCVGASGVEICINSDGDLIPTTDNAADVGSSSFEFKDGFFDGTVYTDAISNSGAYTGSGAISGSDLTSTGAGVFSGTLVIPSSTAVQGAFTPSAIGQLMINTTDSELCISTGILISDWVIADGSAACSH